LEKDSLSGGTEFGGRKEWNRGVMEEVRRIGMATFKGCAGVGSQVLREGGLKRRKSSG